MRALLEIITIIVGAGVVVIAQVRTRTHTFDGAQLVSEASIAVLTDLKRQSLILAGAVQREATVGSTGVGVITVRIDFTLAWTTATTAVACVFALTQHTVVAGPALVVVAVGVLRTLVAELHRLDVAGRVVRHDVTLTNLAVRRPIAI